MKQQSSWAIFWGLVAGGVLTVGLLVAIFAGYLLGHYTHTRTKTVAQTTVTVTHATGASASSGAPATSSSSSSVFAATPSASWLSVGGSLMHENYSPLKQITTSNVAQLKGVWHQHLGVAKAPIYSAEGQSIVQNGVLYLSTGSDDVFAYKATTGKLIWHYTPKPAIPLADSSVVCCGWDSRAVGIGGGMVYLGEINGDVVGLNQQTGQKVWQTQLGTAKGGATITLPITYYAGKVYAGVSGGEYEVRGFMEAMNAKTGQKLWRFWNTASKGQPNGNTWAGNSALYGGASTWNAPSVDPSTNTIFYSTSNASPDFDARVRAGKNLYASSIIALNASTGKLKWYYQEVHHDMWDYDAPSETVLFNPIIHGKSEPAVAEPSKDGMLYVLNRNTGVPLYPTPEEPVVQNKVLHTWPTQPMSPLVFSPQKTTSAMLALTQAAAKATSASAAALHMTAGTNFDGHSVAIEPDKNVAVIPNGASGGDNWQPSAFDESNDMYYVCSQQGTEAGLIQAKSAKEKNGINLTDTQTFVVSGFNTPGQITAFNMNTGKIAWVDKTATSCYSGAVATAGGIVFVGQNGGQLMAFNADNGKLLWSFQTGAGANAPVSVFEDGGQEYVALYAGGNDLAGTSHGDNLWVFGLNGKLGPVAAGVTATAGTHG